MIGGRRHTRMHMVDVHGVPEVSVKKAASFVPAFRVYGLTFPRESASASLLQI